MNYKELDKKLNKGTMKTKDNYALNRKKVQLIDQFYSESDIIEKNIFDRIFEIKVRISTFEKVHLPILITILFGLIVSIVLILTSTYNEDLIVPLSEKINSYESSIEELEKTKAKPVDATSGDSNNVISEAKDTLISLIVMYIVLIFVYIVIAFFVALLVKIINAVFEKQKLLLMYELEILEKIMVEINLYKGYNCRLTCVNGNKKFIYHLDSIITK